jgi:hypothetical protein
MPQVYFDQPVIALSAYVINVFDIADHCDRFIRP